MKFDEKCKKSQKSPILAKNAKIANFRVTITFELKVADPGTGLLFVIQKIAQNALRNCIISGMRSENAFANLNLCL